VTSHRLAHQNHRQALESRVALRLAAVLTERDVDHDIAERLRIARESALVAAQRTRAASAPTVQVLGGQGGAASLGASPWWLRLASLAPLMALALGLLLIDRIAQEEQIQAAAEIDAVLLADELPPTAYTDPGFGEFLRQPNP
jgi:Protein of unknown function (DUF3619)